MKNSTAENTFCSYPFNELAIKYFVGSKLEAAAPCCMMTNRVDGETFTRNRLGIDNIDSLTPEEIFNHPRMVLLRKNLLEGIRDPACVVCWQQEDRHLKSFRQFSPAIEIEKVENPTLDTLDLTTGNACNLRCRMCAPATSNSLMIDQRYFEAHNLDQKYLEASDNWCFTSDPIRVTESIQWKWLFNNTDKILRIKASGGEPFYDQKIVKLLDKYIADGTAEKTTLQFHTNGTLIDDELISKLNQFKANEHNFSIDGYQKTYDYIRYPAKFDDIDRIMRNYSEKMTNLTNFHIALVVSSLNLLSLPNFIKWTDSLLKPEKFSTYVHFAEINPRLRGTDISRLPIYLLKKVQDELNRLDCACEIDNLKIMVENAILDNHEDKNRMLNEIIPFDLARNQSYKDFLDPDLVEWLAS